MQTEKVSLKVYDILGREVATLLNTELVQGTYNYSWDASTMSSGIYFYKLSTKQFSSVKKMMLLK